MPKNFVGKLVSLMGGAAVVLKAATTLAPPANEKDFFAMAYLNEDRVTASGDDALVAFVNAEKYAQDRGFKWPSHEPLIEKILDECREAIEELEKGGSKERLAEELGDLILASLSFCVFFGLNPADALDNARLEFNRRLGENANAIRDERSSLAALFAKKAPTGQNKTETLKSSRSVALPTDSPKNALSEAIVSIDRAKAEGFKWRHHADIAKAIHDKCAEIAAAIQSNEGMKKTRELLGDLLMIDLSFCLFGDLEPGEIVKKSCLKFQTRVNVMLELARADGCLDLSGMPRASITKYWNAAKERVASSP